MFQHGFTAAKVIYYGQKKLVVQFVHHVAEEVGHFGSAGSILMHLSDFFPILCQEVFTAGEIQRPLFIKAGHTCVTNGIDRIGKIGIDKELHSWSLGRDIKKRKATVATGLGADYTSDARASQKH